VVGVRTGRLARFDQRGCLHRGTLDSGSRPSDATRSSDGETRATGDRLDRGPCRRAGRVYGRKLHAFQRRYGFVARRGFDDGPLGGRRVREFRDSLSSHVRIGVVRGCARRVRRVGGGGCTGATRLVGRTEIDPALGLARGRHLENERLASGPIRRERAGDPRGNVARHRRLRRDDCRRVLRDGEPRSRLRFPTRLLLHLPRADSLSAEPPPVTRGARSGLRAEFRANRCARRGGCLLVFGHRPGWLSLQGRLARTLPRRPGSGRRYEK
jgi:hypothetical protein